ncbi:Na+/H+ antiporter subunit B [Thermomicrobium sp. 4228-Ro]|uniref:Na+/H+ antiporter subunit B n=1 Tax=Thermomicrobium sp. 4228-Ro TaxID=2993937 RepID=UPI0022499E3F|nr:Na+/H+ antiporter subunit B [Thermomicrobium sp. 4228-Ro]MCX2728357.1 Na+/H+ antiporter subunit B [Thermomicrobium sp. 4228-Ro]
MTTLASIILRTAVRWISPLLLLFSLFLLLRGHHEPGGGFGGGLVAATAFALLTFGYDLSTAKRLLRIRPLTLTALGIAVALASGLLSLLLGDPFLTGLWLKIPVTTALTLELGSPVLFDIGVYLAVIGATLTMLFEFAKE